MFRPSITLSFFRINNKKAALAFALLILIGVGMQPLLAQSQATSMLAKVGMGSGSSDDPVGTEPPEGGGITPWTGGVERERLRDPYGATYILGVFRDKVVFGDVVLEARGGTDVFIAKFDATEELLWAARIGGQGSDWGFGIALDDRDNLIVSGWFANELELGDHTMVSEGYHDVFLAKFDFQGDLSWVRQIGGSGNDRVSEFQVEPDGGIFLRGTFSHHQSFGVRSMKERETRRFAARYDAEGGLQWVEMNAD